MRALVASLLALSVAGCSLNPKEERALLGGGIGAGAGYLLGGTQGALLGGGAGAILGAVTAPDGEIPEKAYSLENIYELQNVDQQELAAGSNADLQARAESVRLEFFHGIYQMVQQIPIIGGLIGDVIEIITGVEDGEGRSSGRPRSFAERRLDRAERLLRTTTAERDAARERVETERRGS